MNPSGARGAGGRSFGLGRRPHSFAPFQREAHRASLAAPRRGSLRHHEVSWTSRCRKGASASPFVHPGALLRGSEAEAEAEEGTSAGMMRERPPLLCPK